MTIVSSPKQWKSQSSQFVGQFALAHASLAKSRYRNKSKKINMQAFTNIMKSRFFSTLYIMSLTRQIASAYWNLLKVILRTYTPILEHFSSEQTTHADWYVLHSGTSGHTTSADSFLLSWRSEISVIFKYTVAVTTLLTKNLSEK